MKNYHKYLIQCIPIYVIWFALLTFVSFFYRTAWSYALCLLVLLPCRLLEIFFVNKNFLSILSNELDAQKFYNTIYKKPPRPGMLYRVYAEWYIGNYQRVIDLASAGVKRTDNLRLRRIYLVYLARAYFNLRNLENLTKTVDAFDQLQKDNNRREKLLSRYPDFRYFKAYMNREYEECVLLTQIRMQKISKKHPIGKLQWLMNQCSCAIAYYEMGNIDKAKEIFQWFVETTPNLNLFYNLSMKYIEEIEKN